MMNWFKGIIILIGIFLLAGCGNKSSSPTDQLARPGWVKPAAIGGTSAAYFEYINQLEQSDTLLSVNSNVAGMTQVHQSVMESDMMVMKHLEQIILDPGDTLRLEPGAVHIMLMNLNRDLTEGDSVTLELNFSQAGVISKSLPVKQSN